MSSLEDSVQRLMEAYRQAVFDRNADAFMRLYDERVRIFDAWNVWSYDGAEAWRASVNGWFSSLGNERVRVTTKQLRVCGERSLAIASAVFRYAAVSPTGAEIRATENRLTWALRSEGAEWKIVHEHTSVPAS